MPLALVFFMVASVCAGGAVAVTAAATWWAAAAGRRRGNLLESPIEGVSDAAWTEYVVRLRGARRLNAVTTDGRLGAFGFTARELADVGLMSDPHKGARGVWLGTWAPGLDLPGFLADARLQYWSLVMLSQQHAAVVSANYAAACAALMIGDRPVTLSGLLAGAHKAGLSGLRCWVEDVDDRRRHAATTARIYQFSTVF